MSGGVEKLVRMANQIATEFEHQRGASAIDATREHLVQFWDPRMRDAIIAHVGARGAGLSPTAESAVHRLLTVPGFRGAEGSEGR